MDMIRKAGMVVCGMFFVLTAQACPMVSDTVYYESEDTVIFQRYLSYMDGKQAMPFDSMVVETAMFFLGTPYVGATLEMEPEGLVVNLRELDCTTFVESVLALSRTVAAGDSTFEAYCKQLRSVRYREGVITGYLDRLHYTSDWMYENDRKGIVKYVAEEGVGQPYVFELSFMSSHPDSYRQLKADSLLIPLIAAKEEEVNGRSDFYRYIPKMEIDSFALSIHNGDMLGFVTSVKGLDISHVGLIVRHGEEDELSFIHASSLAMEVIVNKESLKHYVENSKSCEGIMLARPLPPMILAE